MTYIQHTLKKSDKHLSFQVQLKWLAGDKSSIITAGVEQPIRVSSPPEFGGEGKDWSPEHLFLGAICSCFTTTYMVLARKYDFEVSAIECTVIGQIELIDGSFRFTVINIFPKVFVSGEALKDKARLALEKTPHYCIVANSIKAEKIYHGEVVLEQAVDFHQPITK